MKLNSEINLVLNKILTCVKFRHRATHWILDLISITCTNTASQ